MKNTTYQAFNEMDYWGSWSLQVDTLTLTYERLNGNDKGEFYTSMENDTLIFTKDGGLKYLDDSFWDGWVFKKER